MAIWEAGKELAACHARPGGSRVSAVAPRAGAQGRPPGPPALHVPMLADPPRLDGRLDETVWTRAAVARGFTQREPRSGQPAFEVMLDTFHDGRNAFYFQTNAVGARRDALIRNEGDAINWEAAGEPDPLPAVLPG